MSGMTYAYPFKPRLIGPGSELLRTQSIFRL